MINPLKGTCPLVDNPLKGYQTPNPNVGLGNNFRNLKLKEIVMRRRKLLKKKDKERIC